MSRGRKILELLKIETQDPNRLLHEALQNDVLFEDNIENQIDINASNNNVEEIVSFINNDRLQLDESMEYNLPFEENSTNTLVTTDAQILEENNIEICFTSSPVQNKKPKVQVGVSDIGLNKRNTDDNFEISTESDESEFLPSETEDDISFMNKENNTDEEIVEAEVENEGTDEDEENKTSSKRRKKRKLPIKKIDSSYQENKKKRELGLPYLGKKKMEGQWKYNVSKPGKFLSNPCNCKISDKKNVFACKKLAEHKRRETFESFWKKSWPEKKEFVKGLIDFEPVKRRRGLEEISRRDFSARYYLVQDLVKYRVCKKMFNASLGLKHNCALHWLKLEEKTTNIERQTMIDNPELLKMSSRRTEASRLIKEKLKSFFYSLPKVESHYCRASTQKLYLEPMWTSKQELYRFYCEKYCKDENIKPFSRTIFNDVFQELNLSMYHPKKDQCEVCVASKNKNISEEEYQQHLLLKNQAREEKARDEERADDTEFIFTMDLQSVLLAPKNNVSTMYYKTKLAVHNFTLFNVKTKDGFCFLWSEVEGALTANEFSSILVNFIEKEVVKTNSGLDQKKIIFWSDGCNAQNRNSVLANALLNIAMQYNLIIIQKYLFKGHTQMQADSMHSTIERRLRGKDINVPADYVSHCKSARITPFPYNVSYLNHTFFKDFSGLDYYASIRPGRKVGDPTVNDLKQLKYTDDGIIQYKLKHSDAAWENFVVRKKKQITQLFVPYESLPCLYNERRKIKLDKFNDLQVLKKSLLPDYHEYYDNIPHT